MVTVQATDLDKILHLEGEVGNADLERLIDLAIDSLNIFGTEISNMIGSEKSKTATVTSAEKGAILLVAGGIYDRYYKDRDTATVTGGPVITAAEIISTRDLWVIIKEAAESLVKEEAGIPFHVGHATS